MQEPRGQMGQLVVGNVDFEEPVVGEEGPSKLQKKQAELPCYKFL